MPGIVGIMGYGSSGQNTSLIEEMVRCMMHEPFYTSGTYTNESNGLWVGWVCHKDSFANCMPVWNETKDILLIFSGENFSDQSDIQVLRTRGHEFSADNAGYLVHLYEELGIKFFENLNGWFSGVLIDLREQKTTLFNDRYGLGRIYYHENREGFYFSSEAKSLLKILPQLRKLNMTSLAETFSCGCVLQNRTLFPNIYLLPGGSKWIITGSCDIRKDRYFSPEHWESQPLLSGAEYYEKLKETFTRVLPRYFYGPRKVGMSLTGGIDGRMIMAWANCLPGELPCYTFGGTYRDCADVKIARKIADLSRQSHRNIVVDPQIFAEFPSLAEKAISVSDGTMDVTGSVELYVNRIASQIAPVRLTGNYGSEIIRGNVAFGPSSLHEELLQSDFAQLVQTASSTYRSERQGHKLSFIGFKQVPWHHYSRLSVEQSQLTLRSPYLDNDLVSLMYRAPPELILSNEPSLRLIAEGNPGLARIPTDRGLLYRPTPIIGGLRHYYQEFTVRSEYAYDYGMPQWLARFDNLFAPLHFERMFLGRHKFYHFRVWYRDQLSEYVKSVLLNLRTVARPYLQGKYMEEVVHAHLKGHRNFTQEINWLLTCELIQRHLIEQE